MKISLISFDMAHNCLGRAYLLGKVLRRRYEVDVHGFMFSQFGGKIWRPCDTGEFEYRIVKGRDMPGFLLSMASMVKDISGDVVYASKLRMPSYGVALLKKLFYKRPVVLDIDDLESAWFTNYTRLEKLKSLYNPMGAVYTELMERFVGYADGITTVSAQLKERFGRGVLVPHGRDTDSLNPEKFDRDRLRGDYNFCGFKVIMFLGTPRPHKGLEDIVKAIDLLGRKDIRFVIVGKGSDPNYERKLQNIGKDSVILLDQIPFNEVPKLLCMADLVVLPQKKTVQTHGQIPAKIFDAMAMAKPIIANNVSDMPQILNGCGIIIEPGDIERLAEKIEWVFMHPIEAMEMGLRARQRCLKEYSWDVMEERLVGVFEKHR